MKKLIIAAYLLVSFSAMAQTTHVIQQAFGVAPPKVAYGFKECSTNQYVNGDCYVVSKGVLFIFNDELPPSAIKKVDLEDGFYSEDEIKNL
ncbi:hypothetical protein KP803_10530 [Vibrio sp. ZSDE26]|uniref:DUF1496 domain-containing protein n=1 Tax=Vibrio amylolyticus TaxID=2847292 RepID=A0A9X2BLA2_9VIBR|nr:hypothetical protein [Vibrio amylolyticus]MCK6263708.1 hypothetical protein [Vibrio amylolyticus]